MRFRQGGFLGHPEDYKEKPRPMDFKEYY